MLWLFRKIVDRLLVKSVVIIGSELESQMEIEISEARAALLRRASELEQEVIPGFKEIAADLRARVVRLGDHAEVPCTGVLQVVKALEHENLRDAQVLQYEIEEEDEETEANGQTRELLPSPTAGATHSARATGAAGTTAAARKRGRPRKDLSAE